MSPFLPVHGWLYWGHPAGWFWGAPVVSGAAGCLFCHLAPRAGVKRSRGGGAGGAGCPRRKSQRGLSIATAACPGLARGLPCTQGAAASPKRLRVLRQSRAGAHGGVLARCPCTPPPPLPAYEKQKPGRKARRALAARSKKRSYFHFFLPRFLFSALVLLNEAAQDLGGGGVEGRHGHQPPLPSSPGPGQAQAAD